MTLQERLDMLNEQYAEELINIRKDLNERFEDDLFKKMEYVEQINKDRLTTG